MRSLLYAAATAACMTAARVTAVGLQDNPVQGASLQYLDGEGWTVSNGTITVGATVPGDLITDLEKAGVIGDPLYELNFQDPVWDMSNFTYTLNFDVSLALPAGTTLPLPAGGAGGEILLVFDGIKMVSDVTLNGQYLGYTADQFLRYIYPVGSLLTSAAGGNQLQLTFTTSHDPRNVEGRFMSCSGGWDWAPYSNSAYQKTPTGASTFSKGIWKSVALVWVPPASAAILHTVPLTYYLGSYPTAPLQDGQHGGFNVSVKVHMWAPAATTGSVSVTSSWGATAGPMAVQLPAGNSSVSVWLPATAAQIKLWWPMGLGAQTMFNVTATFTPASGADEAAVVPVQDSRRLGFRVFVLVTGNDTDPSTLEGQDGSGFFTMRFKVNGANVYSRGGNIIPMEEMEGRMSADAYSWMLRHAAAAHMNTFRLWGGGIYPPDVFYDTADDLGIMIYHDMMYAQGNHGPAVTPMQDAEIRHTIRRLGAHPSIALWDSCNECGAGSGSLYETFIMSTVVEEDASRPPWPSCPSDGWQGGVDTLWSLPNGSPLNATRHTGSSGSSGTGGYLADSFTRAPRVAGSSSCTFVQNIDLDQGTLGPNGPAADPQACCDMCTAAGDSCYAAVFVTDGGACWLKNYTQAQFPVYNGGTQACLPPGHSLPNPGPPKYRTETHGPYQHGEGFPTVNSQGSLGLFSANIPPALGVSVATGPQWWGTFASEFGGAVFSSFESMNPTLTPDHWAAHASVMSQRNYAGDNFMVVYFGDKASSSNGVGIDRDAQPGAPGFKAQLYANVMGQALEMKADITTRRSTNSYGTVTWQLNEIWPTGGWGSIEYGTVGYTPGQVIGGRWKPLHHFMEAFLYRDQLASCGADGRCYVRNDYPLASFTGALALSFLHIKTGTMTPFTTVPVNLPPGAASLAWFCLGGSASGQNPYNMTCDPWSSVISQPTPGPACAADGSDCILYLTITNSTGAVVTQSFELFNTPQYLALDWTTRVTATAGQPGPGPNGEPVAVPITLTTTGTALFVILNTLAQGRFSDNALILPAGSTTTVYFLPYGPLDYGMLTSTLRVEHAAQYIAPAAPGSTYNVTAVRLSNVPILSPANSIHNWTYNAALYVQPSDGSIHILARCQNSSADKPYNPNPSLIAHSKFIAGSNYTAVTPITAGDTVFSTANVFEKCGTEDPRIALAPANAGGQWHLFYTAWNCSTPTLALATTSDPTSSTGWTRVAEDVWAGQSPYGGRESKSASVLFRAQPPHYLFWGDSANGLGISVATSNDGLAWTVQQTNWISPRSDGFDSNLCEGGPPPLPLSDGNYLYVYNSARSGYPSVKPGWQLQYNVGFAILDGTNPTHILQRSEQPIFSPVLDWETGNSTSTLSLTPFVVFVEGLVPFPGETDSFLFIYGAADSVTGVGKITVTLPSQQGSSYGVRTE